VARMGRGEVHIRFSCGNLMVDLGVGGRIMLKWVLKDSVGRVWVYSCEPE
jgi:hypothetical protein